ncbi:hypothetical protein AEY53_01145 [Helicobacter pylori]|nr:hypothetical protein AEY53_01145 [Helicobacter pylori]
MGFLGSFLFKALALSVELERFLTSFHVLRAYLSVTLLARFNKNQLIFQQRYAKSNHYLNTMTLDGILNHFYQKGFYAKGIL